MDLDQEKERWRLRAIRNIRTLRSSAVRAINARPQAYLRLQPSFVSSRNSL